jgi:hypothetical protein
LPGACPVTEKVFVTEAPETGEITTGVCAVDVAVVVEVVPPVVVVVAGVEVAFTFVTGAGVTKSIQARPRMTRSRMMMMIHQVEVRM